MVKLVVGVSGYDVIILIQNVVEVLICKGDLLELDKSCLVNLSNEVVGYFDKDFDKGNCYFLFYVFIIILVGYNKIELDKLGIDFVDWLVIFDLVVLEKIKGRVMVMDDLQELFGVVLKYFGYFVNDIDLQYWKEVQVLIFVVKLYWVVFNLLSYIKELILGNIWVVYGYFSDMYQVRVDVEVVGCVFKVDFVLFC